MVEAITEILTSSNAAIVLLFCAFIAVIAWVLSKAGMLTIHTKNFSVGYISKEREIIRQQISWVKYHYEGMEANLDKPKDYDGWRGKYIVERIFDEYVDWITFNHLTMNDDYIKIKQDKIVNIVRQLTYKEIFHSADFEQFIRDDVKHCIEMLIHIREIYG